MPRLSHSLILKAWRISPLLPPILRTTRTLPSAINELRWLKEHVKNRRPQLSKRNVKRKLLGFIQRRARGEPLQYILGSQPFGNIDIRCKRGVLIPRPETEAYTLHLANLIKEDKLHPAITRIYSHPTGSVKEGGRQAPTRLRILDACSGSGAISLLLRSALRKPALTSSIFILGLDICEKATALACQNREQNIKLGHLPQGSDRSIHYQQRDIFEPLMPHEQMWDIIISNPPYISHQGFNNDTLRSVRNFEPKIALVPGVPKRVFGIKGNPQDIFYRRLIELHNMTFSKVLLMEVGDAAQAVRVVEIAFQHDYVRKNNRLEIWRDNPAAPREHKKLKKVDIEGITVPIIGAGRVRSVIVIRNNNPIPKAGKDYKVRHLSLNRPYETDTISPKRHVYGPPELKSTWKLLNSPMATDGRPSRSMARGWGSQKSSRKRIHAQEFSKKQIESDARRQAVTATAELERPMRRISKLKGKGILPNDLEPFMIRSRRY